jgi:hypothetical protein
MQNTADLLQTTGRRNEPRAISIKIEEANPQAR